HVDRSLQSHLPVLNDDGVLVLRDAVDGPVKRPVKNDACGFTAKTRIVLACSEARNFLFTERTQLCSAIKARSCRSTSSAATTPTGASRTSPRFILRVFAEPHQAAAHAAWIHHYKLLGLPVTRDIRLAGRSPQFPFRVRCDQWTANLLNATLS